MFDRQRQCFRQLFHTNYRSHVRRWVHRVPHTDRDRTMPYAAAGPGDTSRHTRPVPAPAPACGASRPSSLSSWSSTQLLNNAQHRQITDIMSTGVRERRESPRRQNPLRYITGVRQSTGERAARDGVVCVRIRCSTDVFYKRMGNVRARVFGVFERHYAR